MYFNSDEFPSHRYSLIIELNFPVTDPQTDARENLHQGVYLQFS